METQEVDKIRLLQGEIQCLHQQMRSFFAAQEASRRLWGKRLHDETGQLLSVLCMQLQQDENCTPMGEVSGENQPLNLAQQALQAVREMSLDLEPSVWEGLPLPEVLRCYLLSRFQSPERMVEVQSPCSWEPLAAEIETACLRIVQEVLISWEQQARMDRLHVTLRQDAEAVWLTIRVQGHGFPEWEDRSRGEPCEPGWSAAQARVELLGGQWQPESSAANARALRVCLPLSFNSADPAGLTETETIR